MNIGRPFAVLSLLTTVVIVTTSCGPRDNAGTQPIATAPAVSTGFPAADTANEPTPAERRLEWVRAPVSPGRTASLQNSPTPTSSPSGASTMK